MQNINTTNSEPIHTANLLLSHNIPVEKYGPIDAGLVMLRIEDINPVKLRQLGFRLGSGVGQYKYLLYYDGSFCGVVL